MEIDRCPKCNGKVKVLERSLQYWGGMNCKALEQAFISVKDRLPEDHVDVLLLAGMQIRTDYMEFIFQGYYNSTKKVWVDWCGDNGREGEWTITHWMPLPAHPKEV